MPDQPAGSTELPPPCAELVREELQRILASRGFAAAARLRRFLTYVVEQTLADRHDAIKELILGIEVFDRPSDFDPRTDTIVRVEARELRKRLQEYYDAEGVASAVRIQIPKGAYVPKFLAREQVAAATPRWGTAPSLRPRYAAGLLALALLAGGAAYWGIRAVRGTPPPPAPSIAVLPFLNFSPDPANEYIADGLAEDLTDALAHIGGIRVASRTSAFFFKGRQADVRDIGVRLRVDFLVEGSVRKDGTRLKISAQLVRTDDGYHVWSRLFERDMKDIFAVQQEIAESVASTLEQKLTGVQTRRPALAHTPSVEAFDLYLRGRHAVTTGAPTDIDPAERLFQQSIAADPAYARPYLALASLYLSAEILHLRATRELIAKAREAASKALALDGKSAEAHAVFGSLTARHEYNWAAAERHFRDALELDPNSAFTHNQLAQNVLAPQGRWEEAVAENHRAIELDPFSPEIAVGQPWLLYLQRRNDMAIQGFRKLLAANPDDPAALVGLATALIGTGNCPAAIETFEQVQRLGSSAEILAWIAYCHARAGQTAQALRVVAELTAQSRTRFVSPATFAVVYVGLQDRERAFRYLESARQNQDPFLAGTRVDSFFDPLRSDTRFSALLAELGLTDEAISKNQELASRAPR